MYQYYCFLSMSVPTEIIVKIIEYLRASEISDEFKICCIGCKRFSKITCQQYQETFYKKYIFISFENPKLNLLNVFNFFIKNSIKISCDENNCSLISSVKTRKLITFAFPVLRKYLEDYTNKLKDDYELDKSYALKIQKAKNEGISEEKDEISIVKILRNNNYITKTLNENEYTRNIPITYEYAYKHNYADIVNMIYSPFISQDDFKDLMAKYIRIMVNTNFTYDAFIKTLDVIESKKEHPLYFYQEHILMELFDGKYADENDDKIISLLKILIDKSIPSNVDKNIIKLIGSSEYIVVDCMNFFGCIFEVSMVVNTFVDYYIENKRSKVVIFLAKICENFYNVSDIKFYIPKILEFIESLQTNKEKNIESMNQKLEELNHPDMLIFYSSIKDLCNLGNILYINGCANYPEIVEFVLNSKCVNDDSIKKLFDSRNIRYNNYMHNPLSLKLILQDKRIKLKIANIEDNYSTTFPEESVELLKKYCSH